MQYLLILWSTSDTVYCAMHVCHWKQEGQCIVKNKPVQRRGGRGHLDSRQLFVFTKIPTYKSAQLLGKGCWYRRMKWKYWHCQEGVGGSDHAKIFLLIWKVFKGQPKVTYNCFIKVVDYHPTPKNKRKQLSPKAVTAIPSNMESIGLRTSSSYLSG